LAGLTFAVWLWPSPRASGRTRSRTRQWRAQAGGCGRCSAKGERVDGLRKKGAAQPWPVRDQQTLDAYLALSTPQMGHFAIMCGWARSSTRQYLNVVPFADLA